MRFSALLLFHRLCLAVLFLYLESTPITQCIWMVCLRREATEDLEKCLSEADLMRHGEPCFWWFFQKGPAVLDCFSHLNLAPLWKSHLLYFGLNCTLHQSHCIKRVSTYHHVLLIITAFYSCSEVFRTLHLRWHGLHLRCEEFQLFQVSLTL